MRSAILIFAVLSVSCALALATCVCTPRTPPYAVPINSVAETIKKIPHLETIKKIPHLETIKKIPHLPSQIPVIPNLPSLPHLQIPSIVKPKLPVVDDTPTIPRDPLGNVIPITKPEIPPVVLPEHTPTPSAIPHPGSAILGGLVKTFCGKASNVSLCESSIQPFLGTIKGALDAKGVLKLAMKAVMTHTVEANAVCTKLLKDPKTDSQTKSALGDCSTGYTDILDSIKTTEEALEKGDFGTVGSELSAISTDADTCENGFDDFEIPSPMAKFDKMLMALNSNCLAIASAFHLMI